MSVREVLQYIADRQTVGEGAVYLARAALVEDMTPSLLADTTTRAEEAERERDEWRAKYERATANGTGDCYCDTVGETPCAYCQIKDLEAALKE